MMNFTRNLNTLVNYNDTRNNKSIKGSHIPTAHTKRRDTFTK